MNSKTKNSVPMYPMSAVMILCLKNWQNGGKERMRLTIILNLVEPKSESKNYKLLLTLLHTF